MSKELVKNTGIYVISGFLSQGFIFLLWIILAWWLVPSEIGLYTLILFIIEFFSAISILGLDSAITRFYYARESISSILANALIVLIASSLINLFLFFLAARIIPDFIPGLSNILEKNLFLFGIIIFTNSLSNFFLVHYAAIKNAVFYAKFQMSKVIFFFLFASILVRLGCGILGIFYALLLSSLITIILFFMKERKIVSFSALSLRIMKNLVSYGYPLMLCAVFGIIAGYFGRILLDRYTDLATLGIYSFFLMLTTQVNGLWGSFNRAWTPEVFSKFLENREKTLENIKFMAFLSSFFYLASFTLLIIFGELFLFKLLLKEIYIANIHLFYVLLLGPLFSGIYTAAYPLYYYENKTKRILFISILLSGVNILLTLFLVKYFSEIGAAISYFSISILAALVYLFAFKKIMQIPKEIINWDLLLSGLIILSVIVLLKTSSSILFLLFIIMGTVLSYKRGNLFSKRYLFSSFLRNITKIKFNFKIIK